VLGVIQLSFKANSTVFFCSLPRIELSMTMGLSLKTVAALADKEEKRKCVTAFKKIVSVQADDVS
jgi:hypothetical protein